MAHAAFRRLRSFPRQMKSDGAVRAKAGGTSPRSATPLKDSHPSKKFAALHLRPLRRMEFRNFLFTEDARILSEQICELSLTS